MLAPAHPDMELLIDPQNGGEVLFLQDAADKLASVHGVQVVPTFLLLPLPPPSPPRPAPPCPTHTEQALGYCAWHGQPACSGIQSACGASAEGATPVRRTLIRQV